MPWYVQRKQDGKVETIAQADDRKEAHKLAGEYNLADKTAYHYAQHHPCKAWLRSNVPSANAEPPHTMQPNTQTPMDNSIYPLEASDEFGLQGLANTEDLIQWLSSWLKDNDSRECKLEKLSHFTTKNYKLP